MEERWAQIRELFRAALEQEPAEWDRYLKSVCPDDADLRDRVLAMLVAYDEGDTFLEKPVANVRQMMNSQTDGSHLVGTTIGAYQIRRAIAQGGMGVVFEALDTKLDKVVALKMMHPGLARDAAFRQRFEQEAKTLAKLEDPHFVRINAVVEEGANTFIVMEYVEGMTLAEHLRTHGALPPLDVAAIGIQILRALSKAHRQGIIHRDLKPSNIMLTRTSEGRKLVKVLDFGIAKQVVPDASHTRTMGAVGTLFYMSPEQARGLKTIDHRTDLYSLAVTLYEALCGVLPFDVKGDDFTLRQRVVEGRMMPLAERIPDLPPAFTAVFAKALSVNPTERFASADEMREALQQAIRVWTQPSEPVAKPVPESSTKKSFWRIPAMAVFGLLVVAGGFWMAGQLNSENTSINPTSANAGQQPSGAESSMGLAGMEPDTSLSPIEIDTTRIAQADPIIPAPSESNIPEQTESETAEPESTNNTSPSPPISQENEIETADTSVTEQPQETLDTFGTIAFNISPVGNVYVNNRLRMERAIVKSLGLPVSDYDIRIENEDYGSWVCRMTLAADEESVARVFFDEAVSAVVVALDADTGTFLEGSDIFVDGLPISATPHTVSLTPGVHKIEARREGYTMVSAEPANPAGCYQTVSEGINFDAAGMQGKGRVLVRLRAEE